MFRTTATGVQRFSIRGLFTMAAALTALSSYSIIQAVIELQHPLNCPRYEWCLDFRGIGIAFGVLGMIVVIAMVAAGLLISRRSWLRWLGYFLGLGSTGLVFAPFFWGAVNILAGSLGAPSPITIAPGTVPGIVMVALLIALKRDLQGPRVIR